MKIAISQKISGWKVTKILKEFPILWEGWEGDEVGYVVRYEKDGKEKVGFALSNHWVFYITQDCSILEDKIETYTKTIHKTKDAIRMVKNNA